MCVVKHLLLNTLENTVVIHCFKWDSSLFFIYLFCFLGPYLRHMEVSQARSRIEAEAASLHHSHSNARSELHLQPIPQLMATLDP